MEFAEAPGGGGGGEKKLAGGLKGGLILPIMTNSRKIEPKIKPFRSPEGPPPPKEALVSAFPPATL